MSENGPSFPGPRWLHALLCVALAAVMMAAGFAGAAGLSFAFDAPRLLTVAASGLLGVLCLALLSPYAGGPRPRLWMIAALFGLTAGALCAQLIGATGPVAPERPGASMPGTGGATDAAPGIFDGSVRWT